MSDTADDDTNSGAGARALPALVPVAAMLAFVAMVHGIWWILQENVVHYGNLADSDGYARLVRIERLIDTGAWFDSTLPRANWPDGGSLHWTRLFDVILLALALPLAPLLGVKGALYWAGALVSPLMHLGVAAALAWAARPLIGRPAALIAGGLTAIQVGIVAYAQIGHADHHMLLGLTAVVAFGLVVRALLSADASAAGVGHAAAAGVALAVGNWVGTEAQIPMALSVLVLGLPWLAGEARAAARSRALALGLLGGLAVALLIERGPAGFLAVEYDRVSVVHLTQAALIAAFWSAVQTLHRRGRAPRGTVIRLLVAGAGAVVCLAVIKLMFPKTLLDPLKDFDPAILDYFAGIYEYKPVAGVWHFIFYLGQVAIALPWALKRTIAKWPGAAGWAWLLVALSTLVYVIFAANWLRWTLYAGLFLALSVADAMIAADAVIDRRLAHSARIPAKVVVALLMVFGPFAIGARSLAPAENPGAKNLPTPLVADPRVCPMQAATAFLNAPPWGEKARTILSSANFGAEILYRTRHRVTATIHHRNAAGILDGIRILGGRDADAVRRLIEKREIDLILICPIGDDDNYFWKGRGASVFYPRLKIGDAPAWLDEVSLPADLRGRFKLFRVTAGR